MGMTEARTGEALGNVLQERNIPRSVDAWEELLDRDDTEAVESDAGEMALAREYGQLQLHYAFDNLETLKESFGPMFAALRPKIAGSGYPYLQIDLVEHANRRWIENLLEEADFESMGEWLELVHRDLREVEPPEIPDDLTMRKGKPADFDAIVAIEGDACGDWRDGEHATRARLDGAGWFGVLEDGAEVIAYAINSAVDGRRGEVLSCAVAPDQQGDGLGKLILGAATYQLASADAREAAVRVRPDIPQGARTATSLGYSVSRRGVQSRRITDEALIAERREEKRIRGMKARFGGWR